MPEKVVIYIRSSFESKSRFEHQLASCRQYALERDYQVLAHFRDERTSGVSAQHRQLDNLLQFAVSGGVKVAIMAGEEQLSRDAQISRVLLNKFLNMGIRVEFANSVSL